MKNKRKIFWRNFKFKYKLTITNENTLEEGVGIHVSKLNGVSVLLFAVTVIFLIAAIIIAFTPLRNYLPGYESARLDSTANVLGIRESRRIIGEEYLTADAYFNYAVFENSCLPPA